ncbi:cytochrome P450 [Fomes fomentarius]|nr:cytochrome P450 [Fomes fomentarius]
MEFDKELNSYLATSAACGVVSWAILTRWTVRGDHALVFYMSATAFLYMVLGAQSLSHATSIVTLAVLLVYFLALGAATVVYRLSPWHPLAQYPGPILWRISSLFLTHISLTGRRHLIIDRLHERHGPFLRIGPNTLSINSPSAVSIYQTMQKSEAYRCPDRSKVTMLFFKMDDEKSHRERKKIWASLFSLSEQMQLMAPLERRTWQLMRCLERRQSQSVDMTVDMGTAIAHWAYDFMDDMVYSGCQKYNMMEHGDPKGYINTGKKALVMLDSFGQSPYAVDILWRFQRSTQMHRLERNVSKMVSHRLRAKGEPGQRDLMTYLINAELPPLDIERDALVAMQAGSDNTALTMTLILYFLLAEPRYYRAIQQELDEAFPSATGPLPVNDLAVLPMLNAAINETLRFSSPYFLPRVVPRGGTVIDGKFIPEQTVVALAAYSQQTSADNFYPDPKVFRLERWLDDSTSTLGPEARTNKSILASFSFGPYACVARNFAFQEMRFVIARLLLAYDMSLPRKFDIQAFRDGILNMRTTILEKPLIVCIARREKVDLDKSFDSSA